MKRFSSSSIIIGVLVAMAAGVALTSTKALAENSVGQKSLNDPCCEKGECDSVTRVVPAAPAAGKKDESATKTGVGGKK